MRLTRNTSQNSKSLSWSPFNKIKLKIKHFSKMAVSWFFFSKEKKSNKIPNLMGLHHCSCYYLFEPWCQWFGSASGCGRIEVHLNLASFQIWVRIGCTRLQIWAGGSCHLPPTTIQRDTSHPILTTTVHQPIPGRSSVKIRVGRKMKRKAGDI